MMTYGQWCADLERRYERMPRWYWSAAKRQDAYNKYVEAEKCRR